MDDFFGVASSARRSSDSRESVHMDSHGGYEEEDEEITQEEAWLVIGAYFREKGLLYQQLDSFDEFMQNMIQELVNDGGKIVVTPQNQYIPGEDIDQVHYSLENFLIFLALVTYSVVFIRD